MASERASRRAFFAVSALLFAASAAGTVAGCASMSAMGEVPMPGGWTLSMAWTVMCGQSWPGAAASFLSLWIVMTAAMMLPSLTFRLWRCRQAAGRLTVLVGIGYLLVWTALGMAVFPLGAATAALMLHQPALARAAPVAAGGVVLLAGALQFTRWKARGLACCREGGGPAPVDIASALGQGLRLGLHCVNCCAGLTAILLVMGVMDLRAMAVVTAAVTLERLAPAGRRVARAIGAVALGAGALLMARAAGLA